MDLISIGLCSPVGDVTDTLPFDKNNSSEAPRRYLYPFDYVGLHPKNSKFMNTFARRMEYYLLRILFKNRHKIEMNNESKWNNFNEPDVPTNPLRITVPNNIVYNNIEGLTPIDPTPSNNNVQLMYPSRKIFNYGRRLSRNHTNEFVAKHNIRNIVSPTVTVRINNTNYTMDVITTTKEGARGMMQQDPINYVIMARRDTANSVTYYLMMLKPSSMNAMGDPLKEMPVGTDPFVVKEIKLQRGVIVLHAVNGGKRRTRKRRTNKKRRNTRK